MATLYKAVYVARGSLWAAPGVWLATLHNLDYLFAYLGASAIWVWGFAVGWGVRNRSK